MAKLSINGIDYNFSGSGLGATPVAAEITYDGTESNLEATDLQEAVDEVNSKVENGYTILYQVECPELGVGEDTIVPKFGVAEGGNKLLTEIFAAESLDTAIQTLASVLYIFINDVRYNLGEVKVATTGSMPYFFGNEQIGYAYSLGKWNDTVVADTGELFYIELGNQDTLYGIKRIVLKEAGEVKFVNYPLNNFHVHNDIEVGDSLSAEKKTVAVQNSLNSTGIHVSESGNAGVYDFEHENWLLYSDKEGDIHFNMNRFAKVSVAFDANSSIAGGSGSADGVWLTASTAVDSIVKVDQNAYTITIPEPGIYCIDARIYRNDGNELYVKGSIWRKKSTETEWTLLKNCGAIPTKYIYGTLNDTIWLKTTEANEQIGFWVSHNSTSQTAAIVGNGNSGLTITRLA